MRALRKDSSGARVKAWQNFLVGQHLQDALSPELIAQHTEERALAFQNSAVFGTLTDIATRAFQQQNGLVVDGIVGNRTMGVALAKGFPLIQEPGNIDKNGPNWPPAPTSLRPLSGTVARERVFGRFEFRHDPTQNNIRDHHDCRSRRPLQIYGGISAEC